MQKLFSKNITNDKQNALSLEQALTQAKEDWAGGVEVDGKDDALKKYNRLAGGLPRAQRDQLKAHRESLGL